MPNKKMDYTCPMHPDVHSAAAGTCPKCGMALEPATLKAPAIRTHYTCPMHPQIVRDEPDFCPVCGMALEPLTITIDERNPELDSMTRRFWGSAALTLPLLAIIVLDLLRGHGLQRLLQGQMLGWFEFAIATPVVLWGWMAFLSKRLGIRHQPQPEYVYAHFDRCRVGLPLQRRRTNVAKTLSRILSKYVWPPRSLL
jgi:Cu+-exporting ATPase